MSAREIQSIVAQLAQAPGVDGVALVDADTGMVWFHAGRASGTEQLGEAAVEFWRVQQRLDTHFQALGPLQSVAYGFAEQVVALFPCARQPLLVLVCIARKAAVSWPDWAGRVAGLQRALAADGAHALAGHSFPPRAAPAAAARVPGSGSAQETR